MKSRIPSLCARASASSFWPWRCRRALDFWPSLAHCDDASVDRRFRRASYRLRLLEESGLRFSDSKSFFRYANRRLRGQECVPSLTVRGAVLFSDLDKCKVFGDLFSSVFVRPSAAETPLEAFPRMAGYLSVSPSFVISEDSVLEKLLRLKRKCSLTPDGIPPMIFKTFPAELSEPLCLILTRSYEGGTVPSFVSREFGHSRFQKG